MDDQTGSDGSKPGEEPITIKKYANRRLYNTATSSYITLDHLAGMVRDGVEFVVYDAKSGEDITRSVLTHIIVDEEAKGQNLLPISFLRHLISFYGDSLQQLVPGYLETSMQAFARNQDQMRGYLHDTMDGMKPFAPFEEIGKQNMAFFEKAMNMFSPFPAQEKAAENSGEKPKAPNTGDTGATGDQVRELRTKLEQMQKQLDAMNGGH